MQDISPPASVPEVGLTDPDIAGIPAESWPWLHAPLPWTDALTATTDWHGFDLDHTTPASIRVLADNSSPAMQLLSPADACPHTPVPSPHRASRQKDDVALSMDADTATRDGSGLGPSIADLSRLSMRLSSLRQLTSNLRRDGEAGARLVQSCTHPGLSLVDDATLRSVFAWLACGPSSTTTNSSPCCSHACPRNLSRSQAHDDDRHGILREVSASSHQLIQILNDLQRPSPADRREGEGTAAVAHLVMACNAMLLEINAVVLLALRRCLQPQQPEHEHDDARLVLVVHLFSYLFRRRDRAVSRYLSSSRALGHGGETGALKELVEERLVALQEVVQGGGNIV